MLRLSAGLTARMDRIGYFQMADNPRRPAPGTGAIHFANCFAAVDTVTR